MPMVFNSNGQPYYRRCGILSRLAMYKKSVFYTVKWLVVSLRGATTWNAIESYVRRWMCRKTWRQFLRQVHIIECVVRRDASSYAKFISFVLQFLRHKLRLVDENVAVVVDWAEGHDAGRTPEQDVHDLLTQVLCSHITQNDTIINLQSTSNHAIWQGLP